MAYNNPGPATNGIPNTELYVSSGPLQRVVYPLNGAPITAALGNGSVYLQYFNCNYPLIASRIDVLFDIIAASAATTATAAIALTANAGVYSSFLSTNTAGSTTAISLLSFGSTQTTYTYASGNSGNSQFITAGLRPVSCPVPISMAPGEYYVGYNISTSQSSVGLSTTALGFSMSAQCISSMTATNYAEMTAVTGASQGLQNFQGVYSATSGNLPLTINSTQVGQTGANLLAGNFQFVMRNY